MINGVTTIPLYFNFSIIPGIEKKTGKKLVYSKFYDYQPTGRYGRYMEIAGYIIITYLRSLWKKDNTRLRTYWAPGWALCKINYSVEQFTKKEIIWSFVAWINVALFFILGRILYLLN